MLEPTPLQQVMIDLVKLTLARQQEVEKEGWDTTRLRTYHTACLRGPHRAGHSIGALQFIVPLFNDATFLLYRRDLLQDELAQLKEVGVEPRISIVTWRNLDKVDLSQTDLLVVDDARKTADSSIQIDKVYEAAARAGMASRRSLILFIN